MSQISRRQFHSASLALAAGFVTNRTMASTSPTRELPYTLDLRCGSIGVKANQLQAIELAASHGFESVTPDPGYLASISRDDIAKLLASMKSKNLKWGAAGLSVEFRRDEKTFREGLAKFPKQCEAMRAAGVTRVGTWLRPYHDELTYVANFRQHAKRLGECVKIMADHGQRFGMEYVGPKTLWASKRHTFIHTMAETKDLIAEINMPNVGFVLDSWHWYTAHETVKDLKSLTNKDIVACDLNDAPKGIAIDQQIDNRRELPTATGVIDLTTFLTTLAEIGYDGPVRAEPFNQALNKLDNEAACAATAKAMKAAFGLVQH